MDNARTYHAKNLKPFIDNLNILYDVSYSPFLNPIEEVFGRWKSHCRKLNTQHNNKSVIENISRSSMKITDQKVFKSYMHMLKYILCSHDNLSRIIYHNLTIYFKVRTCIYSHRNDCTLLEQHGRLQVMLSL